MQAFYTKTSACGFHFFVLNEFDHLGFTIRCEREFVNTVSVVDLKWIILSKYPRPHPGSMRG